MKAFNKIVILLMGIIIIIFTITNIYMYRASDNSGRLYRVEINRIALDIEDNGYSNLDLSDYSQVINVEKFSGDTSFYEGRDTDYFIREIDGRLYRFDYLSDGDTYKKSMIWSVNITIIIMAIVIMIVMLFIRFSILKPFHTLSDVPYELSKGNLTVPLKENKSRFFGKFIWGMDILRENIEESKSKELELQKEKKTLILSISHDIKTPLSAIKLYSKALSKNLYNSEEKQHEIAENINAKADEIEQFVSQIIKASSEDFLNIEVENSEFYLSEMMNRINVFYSEKLELLKIDFNVESYSDCILVGDIERSIEVIQNLVENAIKYGNGHNIEISFADEEDCRLITISNSGCTLPQNEMPHIFDSFWRGSNVGSNGGSGLGLYICRQLMTKMAGDIYAHRENESMKVTAVFKKA